MRKPRRRSSSEDDDEDLKQDVTDDGEAYTPGSADEEERLPRRQYGRRKSTKISARNQRARDRQSQKHSSGEDEDASENGSEEVEVLDESSDE